MWPRIQPPADIEEKENRGISACEYKAVEQDTTCITWNVLTSFVEISDIMKSVTETLLPVSAAA